MSASSKTSVAAGETSARHTLTASAKRAISPPEAIRSSAPKPAPGLVSTSNDTSSLPVGPASARSVTATRNFAFSSFSGGNSPDTALASFFAALVRNAVSRVAAAS